MKHRWLGPIAATVLLMPALIIFLGHGTLAASVPKTLSLQEIRRESLWRQSLPHTPFYQLPTIADNLRAINNLSQSREISFVIDSHSRIAALSAYASAVSTPGNPFYHHFLTPSQLDREFGSTPQMLT
ncbi:MAG: protease pro-enzyme activation domain-containing protein, partial [Firmicutes bacterium]|nr:protease pro-enzyme activation domain-containing protein [Bacillota bacterium]